jgi:hypothetical protein
MVQAVRRRPLTAAAQVQFVVNPCGIYGDKVVLEEGFVR